MPPALSSGGMSRNAVANIRSRARALVTCLAHAPVRAGLAGLRRSASSSASALPLLDHLLRRCVQRCAEDLGLLAAPRAGWPAGCRATSSGSLAAMRVKSRKPGPGQVQEVLALGCAAMRVHEGEGEQVRQVAHGGEGGVVRFGRHRAAPWRRGLPRPAWRASRWTRLGALDRRQDRPAGRCRGRRRHARRPTLPCRRSGGRARRSRRGRAARAAPRRSRRAWSSPRP